MLSDDEKRPIYDKYGEAGLKGVGGGGGYVSSYLLCSESGHLNCSLTSSSEEVLYGNFLTGGCGCF